MTRDAAVPSQTTPPASPLARTRFLAPVPWPVLLAAFLVALLHMMPYLRAQLTTPPGWTSSGNQTISPDFMQYRVWMRQSLEEGPVVSNRFTTEPNHAYLPVPFYYALGRIAHATGASPESVFAWVGAGFAFLLTVLLFATTRYFLPDRTATWLAFLAMLIGGGLGGYILFIRESPWAWNIAPLRMLLVDPFRQYTEVLDELRGDYVFITIFDTHFLLIWLLALASILSFYRTLRSFSWTWLGGTAALFGLASIAHVYEGVTLLAIAASVTVLCWLKRIHRREAMITTAVCMAAVFAVFVWIALLVKRSDLPMPPWRGVPVHPTLLFLGFPLAWVLLAWGLSRYWRSASLNECFLLGWILGCTLLSLSAPFYPWPNRGVLSLQVPLTIVAASIWFGSGRSLDRRAILVCLLLMGSTPVIKFADQWRNATFDANAPHKFLSASNRQTIDALVQRAQKNDVLVAGFRDRLWLAPEYSGHHYAGHFFLTVDYDRKQAEVDAFYAAAPAEQEAFLRKHGIRFLYVNRRQHPARFATVRGLVPIYVGTSGTLFEFAPARSRGES
ncbi:MAG TPA: hypothetical protein VF021_04785 [Longimicrobiales bacterium]